MPKRPYSPKHHIQKTDAHCSFWRRVYCISDDLFIADLQKVVGVTLNRIGKILISVLRATWLAIHFIIFPVRLGRGKLFQKQGFGELKKAMAEQTLQGNLLLLILWC